jgi:DNA repair photolyase
MSMLHIDSDSIEEYFVAKMNERLPPTRVAKIMNTMKRERGGKLQHESYKARMTGRTEQWEVTQKLFEFHVRRLGFNQDKGVKQPDEALAPAKPIQHGLF